MTPEAFTSNFLYLEINLPVSGIAGSFLYRGVGRLFLGDRFSLPVIDGGLGPVRNIELLKDGGYVIAWNLCSGEATADRQVPSTACGTRGRIKTWTARHLCLSGPCWFISRRYKPGAFARSLRYISRFALEGVIDMLIGGRILLEDFNELISHGFMATVA